VEKFKLDWVQSGGDAKAQHWAGKREHLCVVGFHTSLPVIKMRKKVQGALSDLEQRERGTEGVLEIVESADNGFEKS